MKETPFTPIYELARKILDISRDEYALCHFVQFWSADPRSRKAGWCDEKKDDLAKWVGITRPGLYKMIDRLSDKNLLEVDHATGFLRITVIWIDTVTRCKADVESRKQSLQNSSENDVNKVYKERKQSLHKNIESVNLVTHINVDNSNKVKEVINKAENPPSNPYPKIEDIIPETFGLNAESEKTDNQPGGEILAKVIDPNLPGVVMFDKVDPPAPKTAPEKTGRTKQTRTDLPEIPERLNNPKFCEAWKTLCGMPKWRRKPVEALEMSLKKLAAFDVEFATAQVESAISGNWQGLIFADTAAKYSDWQRNRSNQQQTKQAGSRNGTTINSWDGDPKRYTEKQIF